MASSKGSGLAIGGAMAAVVVASVASYFIIGKPAPKDAVLDPVAIVQPVAEPTLEAVQPKPEVVAIEAEQPEPETVEVAPEPEAAEAQAEVAETQVAPEPEPEIAVVDPTPPSFDLIRVDKAGSMVVAGKAAPGTTVEIILDGTVLGQTVADATGAFVALLDLEPSDKPRELSLLQKQATGADVASVDKVLVMPLKPKVEEAPKIVVAKADTNDVEVIETPKTEVEDVEEVQTAKAQDVQESASTTPEAQPEVAKVEPQVAEILSLETIVYDDLGDVVISGRGSSDDFVRIYLDNKPADVQKVADSGQWKITLTDVPAGLYSLRVDSVNSAGSVTQRVLSPFKREAALTVAASPDTPKSNITIQPGFTLWALAKQRYGSGIKYVQIFEANRDRIKDPDLIYPGQVFDLPN
ncbi:MAG: LysM peptidoglycan-binding domain-containing protein [Amylibacter sp.]|nr:LysM peptidoglycan-binding domain-containing protein [Amylibacter sp.]